jgi:hypothetical protein
VINNSFLICFIFTILCVAGYIINFIGHISDNNSDWGTFGDYIGGITSPIIGIIGVILTFAILNNQNRESRQAEFKYMFQILFDSLEDRKELISIKKKRVTYRNKEALKRINIDLGTIVKSLRQRNPNRNIQEIANEAFWSIYDDIDGTSASYMKNLHNCLKVIDTYCNDSHKKTYADLLRAQMDTEDMIFLLYNGIGSADFANFKLRIERYTMLQDIRNNTSISEDIKGLYSNTAYED